MKLGDYITPTGQKGNILDVKAWIPALTGVVFLFATLGLGQKGFNYLNNKITAVDASIKDPINRPSVTSAPKKTIYG